jgi:hypothetical protein
MTSFLNDKFVEKGVILQEIVQEINVPKIFKETAVGVCTNPSLIFFAFFLLSSPGSVLAVDQAPIAELLKPTQAAGAVKNIKNSFMNPLLAFRDVKFFLDPTVPIYKKSILGGKYFCCLSYLTLSNIEYVFPARALVVKNALNFCCLASWAGYSTLHAIDPGQFKE